MKIRGALGLLLAPAVLAVAAGGGSAITPRAELHWAEAGVPGVSTAAVQGDMAQGPSHFFLKYAPGFVSPPHHHTADHYVVTVAGNLVLVTGGQEHRLTPGSYFAFTGQAPHVTRCEGGEACVMFIDARGKWDVVPEAH